MVNDISYWMNIDNDRRQAEINAAREAQVRADDEKGKTQAKFNQDMIDLGPYGTNVAQQYFDERGMTNQDDAINRVIASISHQIPNLDPNPSKYFNRESIGRELDTIAQGTRDKLTNQMQNRFAPGFERSLIPDSADDNIVNSILGEQKAGAQKILDFNKSRGLLNDMGYGEAQNQLEGQGKAGYSTLSQIGESILGKSRSKLDDIRGEAGSAISGYNYGGTAPSVDDYWGRAQGSANADLAGIEGSIRGAVGTTNVFDPAMALQKGGTLQGPINLTTAGTGTPGAEDPTKRDKGRGLGSSGVF